MSLHRLLFDTANPAESANVGAYLRAGDDGTQIGHVSDALKVNFSNTSIAVTATDLDIRDLSAAQDNVAISDGTDTLAVNNDGSINAVVSATDLDIRNLVFATDKVDVSGSSVTVSGTVAVTQSTSPWVVGDGGGSLTVDATDLDIRDLTHASDSIRLGDGSSLITSTLSGGKQALDVYVANSIDVDDGLANTAIDASAESVTTTSGALIASPLASRKYVYMYNNGSKIVYIGESGINTANGFPLFPGSLLEARIGAAVAIHAVSQSGTQEVRVLQAS